MRGYEKSRLMTAYDSGPLFLPMRGYEFSGDMSGLNPDELFLPMRGYEEHLMSQENLGGHVISPHEGL